MKFAVINLFKSAFNDDYKTLKVTAGKELANYEKLDWKNCLISVNGFKKDEHYIVKENDVITIRQYPSDAGNGFGTAVNVISWIVNPLGNLVGGLITGEWKGLVSQGQAFAENIKNVFSQEDNSSDTSEGTTGSIPTISGAKNKSGANSPIPLLLGKSMFAPIYAAQSYTTAEGLDGKDQVFHAFYCLGYNNVDVKKVSLGIYPLSTDEKNGTSGSMDCTNVSSGYDTVNLSKQLTAIPVIRTNNELYIEVVINNSDYIFSDTPQFTITSSQYLGTNNWKITTGGTTVYPSNVSFVKKDSGTYYCKINFATSNTFTFVNGYINYSCVAKDVSSPVHYKTSEYGQQLELQQGNAEVSLYPQKVVQENFGTELSHLPNSVTTDNPVLVVQPFSARYPQKIELEIQLSNILKFKDDGSKDTTNPYEVEIGCAYSLDGGATYQPFTAFGASSTELVINGTTTRNFTDGTTGSYRVTKFKGNKNSAMRFVASKEFSFSEVFNTDSVTRLKNNAVEFKIWRESVDLSLEDTKYQCAVSFNAIRTWCYDYKATLEQYESQGTESLVIQRPIIEKYRNMTARLGFRIKAGQEIKNIDELNVEMVSLARYCTITEENGEVEYSWSNEDYSDVIPTNNPASLALLILQHPMRGEYKYTDDMLDMESFGKFYEWCNRTDPELIGDAHRYTANGVLSKETKTLDLVNQILACGHGKLVLNGNKYAVWFDCPQEQPVMILNNQNVLKSGASNSKTFHEDIDGYSVTYIDALNDYQEDTQICVPKDNTKQPSEYKLENKQYPWITDIGRVYRQAMYEYACLKLRPEVFNRKVGVDGNLIQLGNLVAIQDDTISVGIGDGAEITEVEINGNYITSIEVDYPFTVNDTSKTYGVKIQQADGVHNVIVMTYQLASFSTTGEKTRLVFAEPISLDEEYQPTVGDIVSFGLFSSVTTEAICISKKENGDGTFTLTFTPYQEGVYEAENGTIPEYVSNVTSPKQNGSEISDEVPSATIEDVNASKRSVIIEIENNTTVPEDLSSVSAIAFKDYIYLSASLSDSSLINTIAKITWTITRPDNSTVTVITNSNNGYYYFDRSVDGYPSRADLADWTVSAKYTNIYGNECANATSASVTVSNSYLTWTPTACTATVTPNQNGLEIKINHTTSGFYGTPSYTIVVNGKTFTTYEKNFTYAFVRTGTGADGYPEASDFTDNNYTVQIYANNEAYTGTNGTLTTVSGSSFVTTNYGTWVPPALASSRFTAVLGKNGITISDNVEELSETQYYGQPYTLVYEYSLDGTSNWQTINDKNLVFNPNPHQESAYYNAAKVRVTRKSTANKSSSVTMKAVDRSSYGTWTTPSVVSVSAKADIDGIRLTLDTSLNSATEYYAAPFTTHIKVSKDGGTTWETVNGTRYNFVRTGNNQEFPEASDLANWQFKAYYTSNLDDGQESSKGAETLCTSIDTSTYGSWTVSAPNISSRVSGRNVTLSFTQPTRADGRVLYGNVRYKVSIKKASDAQYYAPATDTDPRASEDNYKDTTSTFVDNGDLFQQVLPLEGQSLTEPLPVDTSYIYSVVAYNSTSNGNDSTATTVTVIALATSAKDIVAAAITTNKLADDCVTFDKIHAAVVTGETGTFKDLASENLVLGKVSGDGIAADADNYWDLENGEFRVGDENQYLHVFKSNVTGEFIIEFKVGNFEVSATASALSGNTYIYDNNDKTKRAAITSKGFRVEKYNTTTQAWESVGIMEMDSYGNLILTNASDYTTENNFSSAMPDDENDVVYHFDEDYYDNNGTNSKSLEFNNVSLINTEVSPLSNIVLSGEVTIPTTSDDFNFWSKSEISNFDNLISLNSNTFSERVDLAGRFNKNASTDWGLTSTQINNNIAVNNGE